MLDLANGGKFVAQYGASNGLRLSSPYGIAVDDAHAYIAERDAHQVSVSPFIPVNQPKRKVTD